MSEIHNPEFVSLAESADPPKLIIDYTNYKGERKERLIYPVRRGLWFGNTAWHPELQWFLHAMDMEKLEYRDFAIQGLHSWRIYNAGNVPHHPV